MTLYWCDRWRNVLHAFMKLQAFYLAFTM